MGNIFGVNKIKIEQSPILKSEQSVILKSEQSVIVAAESNNLGIIQKCQVDYNEIVAVVGAICGYRIPGELIVDILFMLPVKSIVRCKSVCKAWKSLIDSSVFINKYDTINPRFGSYALRGPKIGDSICPVEICYIVGASNGIICLKARSFEKPYVLFNPSTREYSYVPPQLCVEPELIAVHQFVSGTAFCYLPKTHQYQILFFGAKHDTRRVIDVTTVTLGKIPSSRIAKNVSVPGRMCTQSPTTCGTTIFWLGVEHDSENDILIWYDVVEERFSAMNTPPLDSLWVSRYLRVLNGSVIMFQFLTHNSRAFDIWIIIDDVSNGKSWMKYRTVGPLETGIYPITVCWHDRWILCSSSIIQHAYSSNSLFYYDLDTDQVEGFCNLQTDQVEDYKATDARIQGEFANYQESLVSISSLLPCIDTDRPMDVY